jgi:uroporphyrinogen-III synthase
MRRVLVLRPEPDASATVERARERGLDAVAVPLFDVESIDWDAPEPASFDGVLLTSANAVRHGGKQLQCFRGLKTYAVGEATAAAAKDAGFDIAAIGNSGVHRLLGSIEADLTLFHPCGEDRREPEKVGQKITAVAVYRARPIDAPSLSAAPSSVALIHSPRAGRRFAELVSERATIAVAAISDATAAALGEGWQSVEAADQPCEDALLALAARLCDKPQPK